MQNFLSYSEKFGFCEDGEFVPKIFSNLPKQEISKIFLTIYNANVDNDYKILPKFLFVLEILFIFATYLNIQHI